MLSAVLLDSDESASDFAHTKKQLESVFSLNDTSVAHRRAFYRVARMVVQRAATLSAAYCCQIIRHIRADTGRRVTIAIDGSVFEHVPNFRDMQMQTVRNIFGDELAKNVNITLSKDGSGKGAAVIAALAAAHSQSSSAPRL